MHFGEISLINAEIDPDCACICNRVGHISSSEAFTWRDVKGDDRPIYGGYQIKRSECFIALHLRQNLSFLHLISEAGMDFRNDSIETRTDMPHGIFIYAHFSRKTQFVMNLSRPSRCYTYPKVLHVL